MEKEATDLVSSLWRRSINRLIQTRALGWHADNKRVRHARPLHTGEASLQKIAVVFERDANELAAGAHSGSREQLL
jgi:hypothetical protein